MHRDVSFLLDRLPRVASAPFCPSEVAGSVAVPSRAPWWRRAMLSAGPGLLVAIGYMDPGNWATDIAAGSRFGYDLIGVVALSGLAALVLQILAMRLGLVTGRDLARLARDQYSPAPRVFLWILAELAIVATDVAEVLGAALALHLLIHVPLWLGVVLTAFDTVIVLAMKGDTIGRVERVVMLLAAAIGASFLAELVMIPPDWGAVLGGFAPPAARLTDPDAIYLAIGILGATVMPHNLYLHSSVVLSRKSDAPLGQQLRLAGLDIGVALLLATLVNAAILVMAGAAFNAHGETGVGAIDEAWRLLTPIAGPGAALIFGLALLASGQSATFTGTIAGQVVLEGFLARQIPCWQRRLATRALALVPALGGVLWLGEAGVGRLLVASQVVLSLQLPFALWPLLRFTGDRALMGAHASPAWLRVTGWVLFGVIVAANLWLLVTLF
jgi:manganese transport protein